jgi:hypothetical protein
VAHGAADAVACIEVQGEIGSRITALVPSIDFALVCAKRSGDSFFRGGAIGPRRSGGNIALALKAFVEFVVGAADVLVESVTAALFIACEVIAIV